MAEDGGRRGAESKSGGRVALSRCHDKDFSAVVPSPAVCQPGNGESPGGRCQCISRPLVGCPRLHLWQGVVGRGPAPTCCVLVMVPFVTGWKLGGRGQFSSALDPRSPDDTTTNADRFSPTNRLSFASIQDPGSVVFLAGVLPDTASLSNCHPKMRNPEPDLDSRRPTMDFDMSFVFPSLTDDSRANTNKKEIEGCRHLAVGENPPPFSSTEKYVPKPSDPSSTDQVRQYSGPQTFRPRKNESCHRVPNISRAVL